MSEQVCGLCEDPVPVGGLDFHVNRFHRMMTDRYHALVGGFAESGRQLAAAESERDALALAEAEMRAALRRYAVHERYVCELEEVCSCGLDAILAGDAQTRGAALWEAARDNSESLAALLRHYRRHTDHRCEIDQEAETVLTTWQTLAGQAQGERG